MSIQNLDKIKKVYPVLWCGLAHHKTHKNHNVSFIGMPYLKDIYMDRSRKMVLKKSTQSGVSEYAICRTIMHCSAGKSVLYVLPTDRIASRFVQNRFDKSVAYTKFYQTMINTAEGEGESMHLKHIANGTVAFAGSNSPAPFVEFPADGMVIDEFDRCDIQNIYMAEERMSASIHRESVLISQPTFNGIGIDYEYSLSDQKKWFIKCEHCNHWFNPDFFKNIVRQTDGDEYETISEDDDGTVHFVCDKCNKLLDRYKIGEWVSTVKSDISGYEISKLFSSKETVNDLINRFSRALTDYRMMQRFMNGDLGLGYTAEYVTISTNMMMESIGSHMHMADKVTTSSVIGIDVGKFFHYVILNYNSPNKPRIYFGKTQNWRDVISIAKKYKCRVGVIDALPETTISKSICSFFPSFFMSYFQNVRSTAIDFVKRTITIDRTQCLDMVQTSLIENAYSLPQDFMADSEFVDHMTVSQRITVDSRHDMNKRYVWHNNNKPDHYFLAFGYAMVAHQLRKRLSR